MGESQAAAYLQQKGYHILSTNLSYRACEVDIVALDPASQELVFVEVKTRSTDFFGTPDSAVSPQKIARLEKVAQKFLEDTAHSGDYRFDIISIWPDHVEHYENVSWGMG